MKALTNCDIFDGDGVLTNHAVVIRDDIIEFVVERDQLPENCDVVDLEGRSVCPGFLDLQVNGGGGCLLNDEASPAAIQTVLDAHRNFGTTSLFPTVFTVGYDRMRELLDSALSLKAKGAQGIAGIHFEGPIINEQKAGVHDKKKITGPESRILDIYKESAREFPTLVTLAPEVVEAGLISELRAAGVLVFAGHTDATYEQSVDAMKAGLQGVTHLYNASTGPSSRAPGIVGAALEQDDAHFSIIVDGYHVHWASVGLAWKCKPKGKVFLVTDAMPAVGSDGSGFKVGELEVFVSEGRCQTEDGTLAGSALDIATAIRNCVQKVGIPRSEAIRMATLYPAQFAGVDDQIGSISAGKRADLVVADSEMHIYQVYHGGKAIM